MKPSDEKLLLPSARARLAATGSTVPIVGKTITWCDACAPKSLFGECCHWCRLAYFQRTSDAHLLARR